MGQLKCTRCRVAPRRDGKLLCEDCAGKCGKCKVNPKQSHHRWCAPCRADNERERRSVRITLTRQELKTLLKTARKAQISL
jgi:hypothetical protein